MRRAASRRAPSRSRPRALWVAATRRRVLRRARTHTAATASTASAKTPSATASGWRLPAFSASAAPTSARPASAASVGSSRSARPPGAAGGRPRSLSARSRWRAGAAAAARRSCRRGGLHRERRRRRVTTDRKVQRCAPETRRNAAGGRASGRDGAGSPSRRSCSFQCSATSSRVWRKCSTPRRSASALLRDPVGVDGADDYVVGSPLKAGG
jgi:hypothetical protein